MTVYTVTTTFSTFQFAADFTDAASSIVVLGDDANDNEDFPTPFQVADARHYPDEAAVLLLDYFGRDYWLDPAAEIGEDDHGNETINGKSQYEYMRGLIVSVKLNNEGAVRDE